MDRLLEWWTAYHGWAANLDSEGRLYIIAGSLLLLSIYAVVNFSVANGSNGSSNSIRRLSRERGIPNAEPPRRSRCDPPQEQKKEDR